MCFGRDFIGTTLDPSQASRLLDSSARDQVSEDSIRCHPTTVAMNFNASIPGPANNDRLTVLKSIAQSKSKSNCIDSQVVVTLVGSPTSLCKIQGRGPVDLEHGDGCWDGRSQSRDGRWCFDTKFGRQNESALMDFSSQNEDETFHSKNLGCSRIAAVLSQSC